MEVQVGTLANYDVRQLADRAVERLMELSKPHAVCIDPDGRVTIEPYDTAVFEDVVGVYSRDLGLIPLYREVRDTLAYVIEQRGITGQRRRRYVTSERRAA
jgi:hypothetical protein